MTVHEKEALWLTAGIGSSLPGCLLLWCFVVGCPCTSSMAFPSSAIFQPGLEIVIGDDFMIMLGKERCGLEKLSVQCSG